MMNFNTRFATLSFAVVQVLGVAIFICANVSAGEKGKMPLYAFCGTGDHLWVREREPVDSPATIGAMMEWMSKTYDIKHLDGHLRPGATPQLAEG